LSEADGGKIESQSENPMEIDEGKSEGSATNFRNSGGQGRSENFTQHHQIPPKKQ